MKPGPKELQLRALRTNKGRRRMDSTKNEPTVLADPDIPEFCKLSAEQRKANWEANPPKPIPTISEPARTEEPATIALRAQIAADKKAKTQARIAKLKSTIRQKEAAMAPTKTATATKPAPKAKAPGRAAGASKSRKAATGPRVAKTSPKARKTPARTAAPKAAPPKAQADKAPKVKAPKGMVVDILRLASRPNGVSPAELNALTEWKGAPWKWLFSNPKKTGYCDRWGYKLEVLDQDGTRYKVTKVAEGRAS